jgi:hypothetical protein
MRAILDMIDLIDLIDLIEMIDLIEGIDYFITLVCLGVNSTTQSERLSVAVRSEMTARRKAA